jgi:ATP-dependent DNA helicase PIF1
MKLTQNMRIVQDPTSQSFAEYLLRIGEGREATVSTELHQDYIQIPEELIFRPTSIDDVPQQLIRRIYPDIENRYNDSEYILERTILTPRNVDVNTINDLATDIFPGEETVYLSQDSIPDADDQAAALYPPEFLNTLNPAGMPPHKLRLKVEQPIILMRNVDPQHGLCNGTRLMCKRLSQRVIEAEILVGQHRGQRVFIPRIPIQPTENGFDPVPFSRRQFPIRPAFAMTINKSQGQTLGTVGLYLPEPVFCHGQLYVALSRCTKITGLHIIVKNGNLPGREGTYTRNVVYKNVL